MLLNKKSFVVFTVDCADHFCHKSTFKCFYEGICSSICIFLKHNGLYNDKDVCQRSDLPHVRAICRSISADLYSLWVLSKFYSMIIKERLYSIMLYERWIADVIFNMHSRLGRKNTCLVCIYIEDLFGFSSHEIMIRLELGILK